MKLTLSEKIQNLPTDPGCYLMKDYQGEIIYVGKAKNLKNRVSSYFTGAHDHKTTKMVSFVHDFDTILTKTEKESLILEINLIKEHRPRFNILFMDDKSYPYLKLNKEGLPNVTVSRDRKHNPKFYYFGPYPNAKAARDMAALLNETLPSEEGFLPNKEKIYAKFNRTELNLSENEIDEWRQNMIKVLKGQDKEFKDALILKMQNYSENLNFELAQSYKEKLEALDYISDKQQVQFNIRENFDMFNMAEYEGYLAIVGLFVRSGRLLEKTMAIESTLEDPNDALVSFIAQFYENQPLAKEIYVPLEIDKDSLSEILNTNVNHAHRGKKRHLMDIGKRNATVKLEDQFEVLFQREKKRNEALATLSTKLDLEQIHRIEIFDNSHISGKFAVSACVVFDDGLPNKNLYRRYRLSTGADDVASMKEVIYRRYFRILKEATTFPDLIIVDGGITQLRAAQSVLNDLELDVPVVSLVKDDLHRTRGIINQQEQEIEVDIHAPLYPLLVNMQDEVHRFVINYHRSLRKKSMTRSILEEVEGLGPVGRKKLYNRFSSLKNIKEASLEELEEVVSAQVAKNIQALLQIDWKDVK
ncbi:MAG TPA: excinuclease ABC subunit UvrC [Erysipelothrix sp.]|nr:excinuclease ABC subunit UvrC [Erysipelothrix sp.]